jgi:hypothetical protein
MAYPIMLVVAFALATAATPAGGFAHGVRPLAFAVAATSLGIITGTPKAFTVVFLIFWYVLTNDNGASPALDFAGFYGTATPRVTLTYATMAAAFLIVAEVVSALRMQRER